MVSMVISMISETIKYKTGDFVFCLWVSFCLIKKLTEGKDDIRNTSMKLSKERGERLKRYEMFTFTSFCLVYVKQRKTKQGIFLPKRGGIAVSKLQNWHKAFAILTVPR